MGKLNLKKENIEQQQEKHDAYLKAGLKLMKTIKRKFIIRRVYYKI